LLGDYVAFLPFIVAVKIYLWSGLWRWFDL